MKTGKKILYFLFIVFVFLNIVLFLKLRLLSTSPTIEIINHLPLTVKIDKKKLLSLLEESGFIQNDTAFHLQREINYRPKKIVFTFKKMIPQQKGFIQAFQVNGKQVAGYDVAQTNDNYQIDFYFSFDYLSGLDSKELSYAFQSFPTKAILYLAKIHQKKQRLDASDLKEINQFLPGYLKKYDFIQTARK
jgi:hypothetical protein